MTKLQNPIKERFETVNEDLKKVSRVQKDFGKVLDKVRASLSFSHMHKTPYPDHSC